MKKRLSLGIACLLCLSLCLSACTSELPDATTTPTQTTSPTGTTAAPTTEATVHIDPIVLTVDELVPPVAIGSDTMPLSAFEGHGTVLNESGEPVEGTWRFAEDQNGVSSDSIMPEKKVAYTAVFTADTDADHYAPLTAEIVPTIEASAAGFHQPTVADLSDLYAGKLSLEDLGLNRGTIYLNGTVLWVDADGQEMDGSTPIEKNKAYTWQFTAEDGSVLEGSVILWPSFIPGETVYNNIQYKLYVPESYTPGEDMPVYLYLHGCNAHIDSVLRDAGLNTFAEENDCLVLMPQQPEINNTSVCWNWFEATPEKPGNMIRLGGEPEYIISILNEVRELCSVDSSHIFVGGMSAGAYMSNIMAVTYPDVFAGVMINSGGAYFTSRAAGQAFLQMAKGLEATTGKTIQEVAVDTYAQMGEYARVVPMVVVQGTTDIMVNYQNGLDAAQSWAEVMHMIDEQISTEPVVTTGEANGRTYTLYTYYNEGTDQPVILLYMVDGFGHLYSTEKYGAPNIPQISFDFFMAQ